MSAAFDKPSLRLRALPMLQGFDGLLAFAVLLLAGAGLLTMYSSGFDHGTRFVDHGRNMLLAAAILFVVAQVPPQRLMSLAVPLFAAAVALLIAVELFGITRKGATRWLSRGHDNPASHEILKIAMPLMLAWGYRSARPVAALDFMVAAACLDSGTACHEAAARPGTSLWVGGGLAGSSSPACPGS